jgi:hypothetical protein
VSATAPLEAPPQAGTACPRCGAHIADEQDWCLRCGDAARTRLVPTPNWRLPIVLAAIVAGLALLVIAISFVQLTRDETPATPATATTPPPAAAPPPATTAPPAATSTTPGSTTTAPGAGTETAPGATATATTPGAASTGTTPGTGTKTAPGATTTTP